MLEGGDVQFRLNRGNGRVDELRVAIPPDVSPGKRIRLRGLGENRGRGETGDLLLTIQMQPHPALRIDGNNIEFKLPISLHEAIFGANVEIPTSQGEVTIKVPPMSDSGRRLRLKGYGLLGDNHERGDMLVELMIQLPESFPDSLEPKLKELGKGYTNDIRDGIDW